MTTFDVIVIGGGPGGYVAAIRAAQLGLSVALVEEKDVGGTCLNQGCIPTKALLNSAELYRDIRRCGSQGISVGEVSFDYAQIAGHKDGIVKKLRNGVLSLLKSHGVTMIEGRALLKEPGVVQVTGKTNRILRTKKTIIATGSKPSMPPIPGLDGDKILDSTGTLALTACPERLLIIGGGVIGVEFATLFNNLGSKVTVIEMADTILPGIDMEISSLLRHSMETDGIAIHTGAKVTSVKTDTHACCSFTEKGGDRTAEGDVAIIAAGRKPNSGNLGLENLGVRMEKGFICVNGQMETSVQGVYAIGDVTGGMLLAHAASAQGLVAAANAAGENRTIKNAIIPSCIYTNPEIASVGLTEEEAVRKGFDVQIGRFPTAANGKSMIMGEESGLVKIVAEKRTGEILGAHIFAPRASDMIAEICLAIGLEATIDELAGTVHPHPTVSETIMEAAHDAHGCCVHLPKKRI